jgi:hypothetical protein
MRKIERDSEGDPAQIARARINLGGLIWRLEESAAGARGVEKHSADAVNPRQPESPVNPPPPD